MTAVPRVPTAAGSPARLSLPRTSAASRPSAASIEAAAAVPRDWPTMRVRTVRRWIDVVAGAGILHLGDPPILGDDSEGDLGQTDSPGGGEVDAIVEPHVDQVAIGIGQVFGESRRRDR